MRLNGAFQEDGCPQGMLVWDVGPRGCWRGAGQGWVLLGARWAFREGVHFGGNLQPRSGRPVHAQLWGQALGLGHQLPAGSRTARLAGVCVRGVSRLLGCGLPRINTRGCRGLIPGAAARASATNFFLSTGVLVPAQGKMPTWQSAAGAGARRGNLLLRSVPGPPRPLILN